MTKYSGIFILLFFIVLFIYLTLMRKTGIEGATNMSPDSTMNSVPSGTPLPNPSSINLPASGTTSSNLDKIVNAITSAFTPTASPGTADIVNPPWVEYQKNVPTQTSFANDTCSPPQVALDALPIDTQSKDLTDKHSTQIMSILNDYEKQLDAYEAFLQNPKIILSLNPNVQYVSSLGIPMAKVTYDSSNNSLVNLTVVQGPDGVAGGPGRDGLDGLSISGDIGQTGDDGVDPISPNNIPFWDS